LLITRRDEGVVDEHPALVQRDREDRHDLVAVDDRRRRVDREAAVGVAVVGDSEVGTRLEHAARSGRGGSSRRRR
jgi:hypothetical protein